MTIEEAEARANAGDIEYMYCLVSIMQDKEKNRYRDWLPSGLIKHVNQWIYQMYPNYRREW